MKLLLFRRSRILSLGHYLILPPPSLDQWSPINRKFRQLDGVPRAVFREKGKDTIE